MASLSNRRIGTAPDAESLVRLLLKTEKWLPPRLRERILAFGPEVVPPLIAIVQEDLDCDEEEEVPGGGWAAIHAVDLLGELKPPEAIPALIRVLTEIDWGTIIHDQTVQLLPKFGPAVLEPALAAYQATVDPEAPFSLTSVLAELGVKDERIYQALARELEQDVVMGSVHFAEYGDPRALPLLSDALDRFAPDPDSLMGSFGLGDLIEAIESLGGELTPAQREKVERLTGPRQPRPDRVFSLVEGAARQMDLPSSPVRGANPLIEQPRPALAKLKVGRNDPCPCGSGKKYKKCCLGKE